MVRYPSKHLLDDKHNLQQADQSNESNWHNLGNAKDVAVEVGSSAIYDTVRAFLSQDMFNIEYSNENYLTHPEWPG